MVLTVMGITSLGVSPNTEALACQTKTGDGLGFLPSPPGDSSETKVGHGALLLQVWSTDQQHGPHLGAVGNAESRPHRRPTASGPVCTRRLEKPGGGKALWIIDY